MVLVGSLLVTFHVVSVYEGLDPLLQITRLWERKRFTLLNFAGRQKVKKNQNELFIGGDLDGEFQLVVKLRHQQVMTEGLPHLHDAHHSCIDLVLPVLKDTFRGADLLLHLRQK